ncbi:MAG: ABC transporter ATP-binding protein, partial [Acidimicrobiaceae bacterium]
MHPHQLIPRDKSAVAGAKIGKTSVRRVWRFARPYRRSILGFVATILITSVIALIPPLMFRLIVDEAIPDSDKRRIVYLTIVLVVVALGDAALQIVQRWYSAR